MTYTVGSFFNIGKKLYEITSMQGCICAACIACHDLKDINTRLHGSEAEITALGPGPVPRSDLKKFESSQYLSFRFRRLLAIPE